MTQASTAAATVTIGVDLGHGESHSCTRDAAGAAVEEGRMATLPKGVRAWLWRVPAAARDPRRYLEVPCAGACHAIDRVPQCMTN